jgi:predicted DNA-binding transcriptional regulator YafY
MAQSLVVVKSARLLVTEPEELRSSLVERDVRFSELPQKAEERAAHFSVLAIHRCKITRSRGRWLLLRIPYRDSRELVMDMRRGAHVEVIEPSALREEVRQQLETAARQYS